MTLRSKEGYDVFDTVLRRRVAPVLMAQPAEGKPWYQDPRAPSGGAPGQPPRGRDARKQPPPPQQPRQQQKPKWWQDRRVPGQWQDRTTKAPPKPKPKPAPRGSY